MKTSKNKLIAVLVSVASLFVTSIAMAGGKNGSGGGSRANTPTQGQSQKSQSQQSQQSQSKHLDTQPTNQNSQSQNWKTGNCGQYRIFHMDSTNSGINTTPAQGLFPGGTTGTSPTGPTTVLRGGINTTPAQGLFPGGTTGTSPTGPTKIGEIGGINTAPAQGLFPGGTTGTSPTGPTKIGEIGGINRAPAQGLFPGGTTGTNPTGPTKIGEIGGINTKPAQGLFGGGAGTGGAGTGGTGTGGTGTGGTGTGGAGTGGTGTGGTGTGMPGHPHPGGGYAGSNGGTYTAYRVDADAEPALPANAAPPVLVRIMNPAATNFPISFVINGEVVRLQAGEAGEFRIDGSGLVKFDRGGTFGESSYTLKPGDYRFEPTAKGWELYVESAAAAQTGGLPRNALPGEGSK